MKKPNFFIVGAPKCGTSAMYTFLKEHPEVFMPRLKEPHYFGSDHHRVNQIPMTQEQYLRLFADATNEKRVGESSTSYLHSRYASIEIKEFYPTAHIIIMLRNPVDVMYAFHATTFLGGFETMVEFKKALEAEELRKKGLHMPVRAGILENLYYREIATFSPQVKRYFNVFGRQNVHVIIFDDWRKDPLSVYQDTLQFLDVDKNYLPRFRNINVNRRVRSLRFHKFLVIPPVWLKSLSHRIMSSTVRYKLVALLSRFNTLDSPRAPMDPELRRHLQKEFLPDLESLSKLLDRDLTHWSLE